LLETLEHIDQELLLLINSFHSPFFDQVMWVISDSKFGIPFYLFFYYLAYRFYGFKTATLIIFAGGLAVALADLSSKHLFKDVFMRYRPSHNLDIKKQIHLVYNYTGGKYGFVSSHSANMFAIATTLGLFFYQKNKKIILYLFAWAGLIAYSRMYLGVHYPSDIFVGGILGGTIGCIIYYFSYKYIIKK